MLAGEGIEAEVIDLRTLRPPTTRLSSRCSRARIAPHQTKAGSGGISEIGMRIMKGVYELSAVERARTEVPIPYPKHLEDAALPQAATIVATVRRMLRRG
jgi:pyruvate/2-oxoglutarate/acetoin dehydrogenase E1 component